MNAKYFAVGLALCAMQMGAQQPHAATGKHLPPLPQTACLAATTVGEVSAGASYAKPIGGGLSVMMDPVSGNMDSIGWNLRVVPSAGPRPPVDYAALATPPYKSMNPVVITSDYTLRAQDVVAWNPRHFQFFTSPAKAAAAQRAYVVYMRDPNNQQAMQPLIALLDGTATGDFTFLDAHLIPGTANQSPAAATVAAHFQSTPHTLEQTKDGKGLPLGRVTWMKFRLTLQLPAGYRVAPGWVVDRSRCR